MDKESGDGGLELNQIAADVTQDSPPAKAVPETQPARTRDKPAERGATPERWRVLRTGETGELVENLASARAGGGRIFLCMPDGAEKAFDPSEVERMPE